MLNYQTNEGFYAGVTADCKLIPTPEFQSSITAYYARNGIPFRAPEHWRARAFDAAPPPPPRNARATRLHKALDVVLDRMLERKRRVARDCRERDRRDDTRVAADAKIRKQAEPLDDWGRPPVPDSARGLREDAEKTFLAGCRQLGLTPDEYIKREMAYRPGARAADAGEWSDLRWMEESAAASCGWGY